MIDSFLESHTVEWNWTVSNHTCTCIHMYLPLYTCVLLFFTGEVVFDRTHPGFPPDIIFSQGDELMEFEPNIDQLEAS